MLTYEAFKTFLQNECLENVAGFYRYNFTAHRFAQAIQPLDAFPQNKDGVCMVFYRDGYKDAYCLKVDGDECYLLYPVCTQTDGVEWKPCRDLSLRWKKFLKHSCLYECFNTPQEYAK